MDPPCEAVETDSEIAELVEIANELSAIARSGKVLPGSIGERRTRCGRPNCACHAEPPRLHGPHYQWTRKAAQKTVAAGFRPSRPTTTDPSSRTITDCMNCSDAWSRSVLLAFRTRPAAQSHRNADRQVIANCEDLTSSAPLFQLFGFGGGSTTAVTKVLQAEVSANNQEALSSSLTPVRSSKPSAA